MTNLVRWARRNTPSPWQQISLDQAISQFSQFGYQGLGYGPSLVTTMQSNRESIQADFAGFINGAYKSSGPVFACMLARMSLFSEARFQFQRLQNGRAGDLFGTPALAALERPWAGATTSDLLIKAITDVDLAGNFYATPVMSGRTRTIRRLRPDWMTIILGSTEDANLSQFDPTAELLGYIYQPGGMGSGLKPKTYLPEEVCHFAPIPDPMANYRGMSWVQPILTEVLSDRLMNTHKQMLFAQGAPQPLTARVLTPTGWTRMGDVTVGELVTGRDGKPHEVLAVYPQGTQEVFRVVFSDGTVTECTADHLWRVADMGDRARGSHRTLSLRDIVDAGLSYPSGPSRWSVPYCEPVEFDGDGPLPLDPYFLGLLLGDGSFRGKGVSMCAAREDVRWTKKQVAPVLPTGVTVSDRDRGGWSEFYFSRMPMGRASGYGRGNRLTEIIRRLGLHGLGSGEKFIPPMYMRASISDRLSLLQGLVDSDGHVDARQSAVSVTTLSRRMAADLVDLVGGLGGFARADAQTGRSTLEVQVRNLPAWMVPCRLSRKVARFERNRSSRRRQRFIASVEPVGRKPTQCIALAGDEHLYVTDDFVVTHNTPNLVVSMETGKMDRKTFEEWIDLFESEHAGAINAYRTLYLGAGATATVVGSNLKDLDYKVVQAGGETRIASAAGIPPMIVGFSEGLDASTLANFGQARRLLSDKTLRPLWRMFCGRMETLVPPPPGARLWYDAADIAFLQEDEKDAADTLLTRSTAARLLVDAGYDPDSVVAAITSNDLSLLVHSGLYSVQLQPPGTGGPPPSPNGTPNGNGGGGAANSLASAGGRATMVANPEQLAQALLAATAGQ